MGTISLYAKEIEELDSHEREMEEASGMIREKVIVFGKHLAEIHESGCWKARHKSFDLYCEERWRFTGSRGRQLVDAYGVAKNLAAMTDENQLPNFLFEYFTESHARVLKSLPPEQQREAWQAATANGEAPTARVLADVVDTIKSGPTPEEIYAMPKDEQHAVIAGLEAVAEQSFLEQRMVEILALAMKRLRAVSDDIRDEKFAAKFGVGEYQVTGGIVGLATILQESCSLIHEQLTAPLLEE